MKKIKGHGLHYISLFLILVAGVFALNIFSYDKYFQVIIVFLIAAGYVVWGIIHHKIHKDLYLAVVLEYITVAIIGLVIVLSLIYRV